jgi:prefoldin subunit 5
MAEIGKTVSVYQNRIPELEKNITCLHAELSDSHTNCQQLTGEKHQHEAKC